jgi:hypothetical protein
VTAQEALLVEDACQFKGTAETDGSIECQANQSCFIESAALLGLLNTSELVISSTGDGGDDVNGGGDGGGMTVEGPGTASWGVGTELSYDCCDGGCTVALVSSLSPEDVPEANSTDEAAPIVPEVNATTAADDDNDNDDAIQNTTFITDDSFDCVCLTLGQTDYRGTLDTTISDVLCQRWDSQEPHAHNFSPENYTLLEQNYCRNPDDDPAGPWCYTTDNDTRYDYCQAPECPECPVSNDTTWWDDDFGNWPLDYFNWTNSTFNYSYYEQLLDWAVDSNQASTQDNSHVIKIQEYGESVRIGKIVSLFDVSDCCWDGDQRLQLIIARAVIDFNNRSSLMTSSVEEQTRQCNFYLSLTIKELNELDRSNSQAFLGPVRDWQDQVLNTTVRPMGFVGTYEE